MCAGAPADGELRSGPPAAAARPPRHVTAEPRRSVPPGHGAAAGRGQRGARAGGTEGSWRLREEAGWLGENGEINCN